MYDNGLLKYYGNKLNLISGHLVLDRLNFKIDKSQPINMTTYKIFSGKTCKFFLKVPLVPNEVDCEVLLSQIYKNAGINTPIYTPVAYEEKPEMLLPGVMSNNICTSKKIVIAKSFFEKLSCREHCLNSDIYTNLLNAKQSLVNFSKYFTKDAIREFIKIQLFDLASYNIDRNTNNFYFEVENGKAVHTIAIDQGRSISRISSKENPFLNYCGGEMLRSHKQMVELVKNNEMVNDLVNVNELAEEIGNLNPQKTAEDIKQTIDFEVDKEYIDLLEGSCQETANMLI